MCRGLTFPGCALTAIWAYVMVPRERHTRGGTALESRDGQGQALACLFVRMRIRSRSGWPRVLTATTLLLHLLGTQAMAGALERAMLGKSTVVDLTHPIEQGAAGIGGAEGPRPDPNGEKATAGPRSAAGGELGTRLNALGLARKTGATVARIPSRELFAQAIVVDVTKKAAEVPGYRVTRRICWRGNRRTAAFPSRAWSCFRPAGPGGGRIRRAMSMRTRRGCRVCRGSRPLPWRSS